MSWNLRKRFGKKPAEEPGPEGFYQPKGRYGHSSVLINNDIFVWGGQQEGLPEVHMSNLKLKLTSIVEVFRDGEGRWKQHSTTGTPPLGVIGCASCAIGHKIYYFGGYCNHDKCRPNSLHELDIDDFKWTVCMANSDNGPMKKNACGMVAFHQVLLVVGGAGIPPKNPQYLAQYDDGKGLLKGIIRTNEHHAYALGTDEWSSPTVSGNRPPPICGFTLSKFAYEKALMYGGNTLDGSSSDLRLANVIGESSVHWESLAPLGPEKPRGRWYHAVTIIQSPLMGDQQTLLLVAGGWYEQGAKCNDFWLLSVGDGASWREVKNMPPSVTDILHSINTIAPSHSCVWLMAVGGFPLHSNVVTFLELNLSPNKRCKPGSVLKGDKIYQEYGGRFSTKFPANCQTESLAAAAGRRREAELEQQLEHNYTQVVAVKRDVQIKDQQLQLAQQQLQEKDQQLQQQKKQIEDKDQEIQDKDQSLQYFQQQIQRKDQQIQEKDLHLQHAQLQIEAVRRDMQTKDQQLQEKDQQLQQQNQQLQENAAQLHEQQQQIQEKDQSLQRSHQQVQQLRSELLQLAMEPWVISRDELTLTQEVLGSGAYGEVRVAVFRGLRVAAKCLHNVIASKYNIRLFSREMSIASQVRHPNLLLFIGATIQGKFSIILTELMATSLRAELDRGQISQLQIKSIAIDVSCGLNYLHLKKPEPIIHRDVSSPNILMEPIGAGSWKAKVSDYGSANFVRLVTSTSVYPGNPCYAAPEANLPIKQSPKMDVYSFGVLLTEMSLHQPPETTVTSRAKQAKMVQWDPLAVIIEECMASSPNNRPTFAQVMEKLKLI